MLINSDVWILLYHFGKRGVTKVGLTDKELTHL